MSSPMFMSTDPRKPRPQSKSLLQTHWPCSIISIVAGDWCLSCGTTASVPSLLSISLQQWSVTTDWAMMNRKSRCHYGPSCPHQCSCLQTLESLIPSSRPCKLNIGLALSFLALQLVIGDYGLSYDEQKIQMSLWSFMSSPMFMSTDLRKLSHQSKTLLQNYWQLYHFYHCSYWLGITDWAKMNRKSRCYYGPSCPHQCSCPRTLGNSVISPKHC